ncbi:putative hydrolase of the HAD superfamily [Gelidibacter sediminis]|uniref:Putative hydrolase of the HAD superfamily n=1 Tax=Gelidibacter sediminis TaxID=1608710 RepID=A0A4R7PZV7_9FLAO|nr:HAD family hydrolase [Gelidibacter sediminis]TDU40002.1 putative hydrolase of the HAD superfamily [Gelidibacter sediminis]
MDIKVDRNTVVVFDLDDTLYNELDFLKSAYKSIAQHLEPKQWKPLYSKMFSLYRCKLNVFEFLSKMYNIDLSSLIEMYQHHQPDIQVFDGVLKLFEEIKNKKGRIGIVTDGRTLTQRAKLESLGVLEYIDKIIISEEFGSEKPNIANFKAIESFLPATLYYYIADNLKKDFIGPHALGWRSIALIDNGKNIHYESHIYMEKQSEPNNFIIDFNDIKIA